MYKYDATIVIPTFNRTDLLRLTLGSLSSCRDDTSTFEVVIADDGSSSDNLSVIREFETYFPIKYIYQPDHGFRLSRVRNIGSKLAEGWITILLDTGLVVERDFVRHHLTSHRGKGSGVSVGYVFGFAQTNDQEHEINSILESQPLSDAFKTFKGRSDLADIREPCYQQACDDLGKLRAPWALAWACNLSIKTSDYADLGGFDENYNSWGAEDIDFALTAFRNGLEVRLIRDAEAIHLPHPKSVTEHAITAPENKRYLSRKHGLSIAHELIDTSCVELNLR